MLSGLYFPSLRPPAAWCEALRLLPLRLAVYGTGVDDRDADGGDGWETRLVAPLGADASRFRALLREMTGREAEFFRGQLLAQASRPGRDRDEATGWDLAAALHRAGHAGAGGGPEVSRAERLWQARLFLKLAEAVRAAEDEVHQGLAAVARRQAEMLQALQGDEDEEAVEALPLPAPSRPVSGKPFRTRDLLAAWGALYLQDPAPPAFLLTDDPEAAALLAEAVEKRAAGRVLALPALNPAGDPATLAAALAALTAGKVAEGSAALAAAAGKEQGGEGAATLELVLLPGEEFRQALAGLSGLADELGATAAASPFVLVGAAAPGTSS